MNSQHFTPESIARALGLEPLSAEGGLYRETYRSAERLPSECLPERYPRTDKPFGTAIYYLLTDSPDSFSALHRLPTDEVYHFYLGDMLEMSLLNPDGSSQVVQLGQDILNGEHLQFVVPRGVWQGSRVAAGGRFALVGTTMAPGFTPDDFELGRQEDLLAQYPQARKQILDLTRA